jgi:hypothetical protein
VIKAGEKEIVTSDKEQVAKESRITGTDSALHAGMMKPPLMSPRLINRSELRLDGGSVTGTFGEGDGLSVTWKGWTNGGGERASTAAQFSRLGGNSSALHAPFLGGPAVSSGRLPAAAVGSPLATVHGFPVDAESLLAPVGTAIERLVLTGRDQLSLTVRFGEGGSLSLKLVLRGGEIATQIQTDVPGLEAALRSSWNQLAQEWQGRGLKLGNPEFVGGEIGDPRGNGFGRQGRGSERDSAGNNAELPAWRAAFPTTSRRPAHSAAAAATTTTVPGLGHSGLETWA